MRAGYESEEVTECQKLLENVFENVSRRYEGMTGGIQGRTVEDEDEVEYRINLDGDDVVLQYTFDSF